MPKSAGVPRPVRGPPNHLHGARATAAQDRTRDVKAVTERTRILELLRGLSVAASGIVDEVRLASLTVRTAMDLVGADGALLRWYQADSGLLRLLAIDGDRPLLAPADMEPKQSVLGEAFLSHVPVVSNDHQHDAGVDQSVRLQGVTAMMAVPLLVGDRAVGALGVLRYGRRRFRPGDASNLALLGAQVAASIAAARLISEMLSQARILSEGADRLASAEAGLAQNLSLLKHAQAVGGMGTFVTWVGKGTADLAEWSDTALSIFGYTRETFGATRQSFWQGVHPDDVADVRRAKDAAIAARSAFDIRHRIVRSDGELRWVHTRAGLECDKRGAPVRFLGVMQDVTDEVLAGQAIRDSEERFRGAFEGAGIGMALINPQGEYVQVNDAMCRMLGYAEDELVGRRRVDFVHGEDAEANRPPILDLVGGRRQFHMSEIRYRHRDGHLVWGRLHASVINGSDGELRYYVSQVEDITESKSAMDALAESELRRTEMINALLDGLIMIDGGGMITEFNPAASRMFGHSRREAIGAEHAKLLFPSRFRKSQRAGIRRDLDGGGVGLLRRVEMIGQRAGGGEFPMELSFGRFEVGGVPFLSASIRDLSDRDDLAESQALLARVVQASPVMLFAFDVDGKITLAEGRPPAGLTTGAAVGGNVFDLLQNIPEAMEHIQRGLAGESFIGQVDLPAHDLWLEVRYEPIRDASGHVIGISGMAADISDRIRGQTARRESDAKSHLVAVVNHEIRTPLNSILGFAELLQLPRIGPLNDKQTRYLSNIDSAGRHLLSLVNDLLDFSKIGAGEMGLELIELNLAELIEQAAGQVLPLIESRGLEIRIDAAGRLGAIGDRRRVIQILWNLLSNSIRHTLAGGVISVTGVSKDGWVEVAVADTGVGIPQDQLGRIFEDYKQVGVPTDGTGLGLPLSRRLAQLMNGDIGVVSVVGHGSTFTLSLPAAQ